MIEIQNLVKRFGNFTAVNNISFSVKKGEIIGFLGPNGAGKTTTMRIITTFSPATYGTVLVDGYDIFKDADTVRKKIGYLPERPPLYFDMRVDEYLSFAADIKAVPKNKKRIFVEDAIAKCGLGEMRKRLIGNLSKGYKQRVGIAQAIVNKPELLILDEPTSGLDPVQIKEIRSAISELAGEHTIILSTHILPEVSMTCERIIIINRGQLVVQDTPENLEKRLKANLIVYIELKSKISEAMRDMQAAFPEFRIFPDSENIIAVEMIQDKRPEIIQFLVAKNYELLSVKKEAMTLEEIFLQLVTKKEE